MEFNEDVFENSSKAMVLVNEHAVICNINRAGVDLVGITADNIVGKLPGEILKCISAETNTCGEHIDCAFCNLRGALKETFFYKSEIINRPININRYVNNIPSILNVNISASYVINSEPPMVLISIIPDSV